MRSAVALGLFWLPFAVLAVDPFTLQSAEIKADSTIAEAQLFNGFGCKGGNVSPSLSWKNAPALTRSFAITIYDRDAPTGRGFWHWVIFNIPADVMSLPLGSGNPTSGKPPKGAVQSKTDSGKPGYVGPCPPKGDKPHRYVFSVYALKVAKIDADENASGAQVGFMLNSSKLGEANFTAMYGRK